MDVSWLSRVVSIWLCLDNASAGAILVPGVTCHSMSKSCRNNDHLACHLDNFRGSLILERFLWSVMMVMGCVVP